MRFAIFPLHLSKVLRLLRKGNARSYEVLHLSCKIISANLKAWCSKMQPLSGNQRPDLLTALMNMSLARRLPREMHLARSSAYFPRLPSFFETATKPSRFAHILTIPCACHAKSEHPKVFRTRQFFALLTSKCASRHNGVRFFDIWTFISGPNLVCFAHFDLEMCFAPQRRALFHHLNFHKWSEPVVLCTCWLGNVLRATTACSFSSSQLPKVVRACCAFYILTWKSASRRNGVHFLACTFSALIWPHGSAPAALASLLFDPPEPQIIGKTQCFATFLPFRAPGSSFFWDFLFFWSSLLFSSLLFSSLLFSSLLFSPLLSSSLLFSGSSHLCFSSAHTVGSLTSKLPSMM